MVFRSSYSNSHLSSYWLDVSDICKPSYSYLLFLETSLSSLDLPSLTAIFLLTNETLFKIFDPLL